jgi:hypothetical protein
LDVSESCNQGTHLTFLVGLQEGDQFDAIFVQQTPHKETPNHRNSMFLPYLSDVLQHEDVAAKQSQKHGPQKICRKHLENHHRTRSARLLRLYAIRAKFRLNRKSCPEGFGVSELFLGV